MVAFVSDLDRPACLAAANIASRTSPASSLFGMNLDSEKVWTFSV